MRSKDMKYLGVGLSIGIAIMSLFLGTAFLIPAFRNRILPAREAVTPNLETNIEAPTVELPSPTIASPQNEAPTSMLTMENTPTSPPPGTAMDTVTLPDTLTTTDTISPLPTPTLTTAELLLANGQLAITGSLTREQQLSLYNAAMTFIAPTYEESKKMSVAINGLHFSDPNTTCGPLSLAILEKAQIVNTDHVPHDFFLINPDNGLDRQLIEQVFPNEHYTNTRYRVKLNQVDWLSQPLVPGDFLYIYAGEQGNFEHMLVVTRVDSAGRAYSVTNYNTQQGFVINEVMLYDPADSTAGIFAQWTKRKDQLLGSTGFAGFEVWRFFGG
jgi:hypothetical protein